MAGPILDTPSLSPLEVLWEEVLGSLRLYRGQESPSPETEHLQWKAGQPGVPRA